MKKSSEKSLWWGQIQVANEASVATEEPVLRTGGTRGQLGARVSENSLYKAKCAIRKALSCFQ